MVFSVNIFSLLFFIFFRKTYLILNHVSKTIVMAVKIPETCKVPSWGCVSKTAGCSAVQFHLAIPLS